MNVSKEVRHLRSTHARFNRGAARYDAEADVQRETAARLIEQLKGCEEPLRVLDAGCGSGILTRMLLERFPHSRVDAFDISEAMLDTARATISAPCVRWLQSEFALYRPALPYPLVVSNASLHWAPSLTDAVENLANCLAAGGCLAISLMVEGTLRELRESLARVAPAAGRQAVHAREVAGVGELPGEADGGVEPVLELGDEGFSAHGRSPKR